MLKEFVILRHGEPFLFGMELIGVTWLSPLIFERPIEKLGGGLELFWDGELYTADKVQVTRLIAHWKKQLNRQVKRRGTTLENIVDMGPLTEEERREFLASAGRTEAPKEA